MEQQSVACLVEVQLGEIQRTHIIGKDTFVVGRSMDAAIPVLTPNSSRYHFQITLKGGAVYITDLNSNNGTFVDHQKIPPQQPVAITRRNIVKMGGGKEEFRFLILPLPVEMMDVEKKREIITLSMVHIREEMEAHQKFIIEEERKRISSEIRQQQETDLAKIKVYTEEKLQQVDEQAKALLAKAQQDSQAHMNKTQQEAQKLLADAQKQTQEALNRIDEVALRKRTVVDQEIAEHESSALERIKKMTTEAESQSQTLLLNAQVESRRLVDQASKKGQDEELAAYKKSTELVRAAEAKASERLREIEKRCEDLIREAEVKARSTADHILNVTKEAAKQLEIEAQRKAQTIVEQHEAQALEERDSIIQSTQHSMSLDRARFDSEMKERREAELSKIRSETLAAQDLIVQSYKEAISKLRKETDSLVKQSSDLEKEHKSLKDRVVEANRDLDRVHSIYVTTKSDLAQAQGDLLKAVDMIKKSEEAEKDYQRARQEEHDAKTELQKHQKALHDGLRSIEMELQAKRDKEVTEFNALIRRQEEDAARHRLESLGKLKQEIENEEKKYQQTVKMRASEMAQKIEERLLMTLQNHDERTTSWSAGYVSTRIREAVDAVLGTEATIQAVTDHIGQDREAELRKRAKIKKIVWTASAAVFAAGIIFRAQIYQTFVRIQNEPGYVHYLLAKRAEESTFVPEQTSQWRERYYENVIYLEHYYDVKTSALYEKQWALHMNDVELLRSMNIAEDDMVQFLGREAALVRELRETEKSIDARYLNESLAKLKDLESEAEKAFVQILKSEEAYKKVKKIEKDFTLKFMSQAGFKFETRQPAKSPQ